MSIKAVLFDRDGVLTYFDVAAAATFFQSIIPISIDDMSMRWREWATHHLSPKSLEEEYIYLRDFWNESADTLALSDPQRQALLDIDYTRFIAAYPEAHSVLQVLRCAGIKIGVLSNFGLASLDFSLGSVGLLPLIDAALAAPVIGVSKPHPRAYAIALEALGVSPVECLFFDDEAEHVKGACAVGMDAFLVDRSVQQHNFAAKTLADLGTVPDLVLRRSIRRD